MARFGAVGEHGPNLAGAGARGFKDDVTAVGRPAGTLVAAVVTRELHEFVIDDGHGVNVVISVGTLPTEGEKFTVG